MKIIFYLEPFVATSETVGDLIFSETRTRDLRETENDMWKPIHTFPHPTEPYADSIDNRVLLANDSCIVIGYALYDYDEDGRPELNMWTMGDCWEFEPTHWAPLPDLPASNHSRGEIMNHAREAIMDILRQRRGLDPDDTSQDELIQKMSARRAFDECCRWHIGPSDWASSILGWLRAAGYTVTENDR